LSSESSNALNVALHAEPASARAIDGNGEDALATLLASSCARAYTAGCAEGERRAVENAASLLHLASERIDAASEKASAQVAEFATALAIEIARVVLRTEVARGHYDLERIVRDTLHHSGVGRGVCVVHLNPADAAALANVRFRAGTTIEADEAVARGDVHVTTPRGLLVREIDEVVRAVAERLRGDAA
jgi:flagellar biosynthesis/type III secretory pathway protein FliH